MKYLGDKHHHLGDGCLGQLSADHMALCPNKSFDRACQCAKWRLRAFAIRCCTLARKSEFIENQARILALAAEANAKADLEECHAGRLHP